MIAAALLIARLPSIPPVVRGWKKNAKATFRVLETTGEDEGKATATYIVRATVTEVGKAKIDLLGRKLRLGASRQGGISPRGGLVLEYSKIGPVQGVYGPGMAGGNSFVWALSAPGWGGTGFTGKAEKDGWHGEALFGSSDGRATVSLKSHLGYDGWPKRVELVMQTTTGGYTAEIVRL